MGSKQVKKLKDEIYFYKFVIFIAVLIIISCIAVIGYLLIEAGNLRKQVDNLNESIGIDVDLWCHQKDVKMYLSYGFSNQEVADIFVNEIITNKNLRDLNCEVLN
jgi:hypothetical protein